MQIRIPRSLVRAADRFGDVMNAPVWERGRLELRRLDLLMVAFFFGCVAWYWHTAGWFGAVQAGLAYVVLAMLSLWMF